MGERDATARRTGHLQLRRRRLSARDGIQARACAQWVALDHLVDALGDYRVTGRVRYLLQRRQCLPKLIVLFSIRWK